MGECILFAKYFSFLSLVRLLEWGRALGGWWCVYGRGGGKHTRKNSREIIRHEWNGEQRAHRWVAAADGWRRLGWNGSRQLIIIIVAGRHFRLQELILMMMMMTSRHWRRWSGEESIHYCVRGQLIEILVESAFYIGNLW